ncbi:MAG: hydrogenase maturation nickel metallochaperone HypA/HybF [Planctomycetota bacterium]
MHETMVAQSLLEAILAEATKQNARPLRAKMSCGAMNHINEDTLSFAFDALSKGTKCEGMELAVEQKPIKGKCNECNEVFEFEIRNPVCSHCGKDDFNLLPDEPMMLEEIEFETENEDV